MNSEDGTGTDLGRRFAMQTVEDRLRELSANILRTMRGAGRPHEILPQAQALVDAALSYREQFGQLPASEAFGDALSIGTPDDKLNQMGDERELVVTAREVIVSGALQVAASRLLGQRAQEPQATPRCWTARGKWSISEKSVASDRLRWRAVQFRQKGGADAFGHNRLQAGRVYVQKT